MVSLGGAKGFADNGNGGVPRYERPAAVLALAPMQYTYAPTSLASTTLHSLTTIGVFSQSHHSQLATKAADLAAHSHGIHTFSGSEGWWVTALPCQGESPLLLFWYSYLAHYPPLMVPFSVIRRKLCSLLYPLRSDI